MCHKYSTVKGRQRCLGEAGGKNLSKAISMSVKIVGFRRNLLVKEARTKASVPNSFGQDCSWRP